MPRLSTLVAVFMLARTLWAANDPMALGAIDAIEAKGRVPGRDILVGGVDWTTDGLDAIRDGKLELSAGGHFMEGAWALILMHDWRHGVDFVGADGKGASRWSPMKVIGREELDAYRGLTSPDAWARIDFRKLSRVHNPALETYAFGPTVVMRVLDEDDPEDR